MPDKKVLDVMKVGFHGNTGDNRTPESFPFPACMASLMQSLGEDYPVEEIDAHNKKFSLRKANLHFITATGMAFGLLWSKDYCMSCMDLMQVNDHDETIRYGYDWAGYEYEIIEKPRGGNNREFIRKKIVESIDNGIPVLAFGIIGPPECSIISGYDHGGDTLIGWSHFQAWEQCDEEPNGMFRKTDWHDKLWKIIITGKKTGPRTNFGNLLSLGLSVMEKTQSEGYVAGLAVYDEWIRYVLNPELDTADDKTLEERHKFHHTLTGSHAEARCWGGYFLLDPDNNSDDKNIKGAGECFTDIHDLCWKVWGVLGEYGEDGVWKGFRDNANRKKIAEFLREIRSCDEKAMEFLRKAVRDQ